MAQFSIAAAKALYAISSSGADENEHDVLGMSDEEFMNLPMDEQIPTDTNSEKEVENGLQDEKQEQEQQLQEEEVSKDSEGDDASGVQDGGDTADEGQVDESDENPEGAEGQPESGDIDYKSELEKLFEPIRSSHRTIKIRDIEHARALIQMGDDYNKKMQRLKPHLRTLKTLEREGILGNEEEINLLLEARKGNPDAIRKIVAQAQIDPLELADEDAIKASEQYRPQDHLIPENELAIEEVLESIKGSEAYPRTVQTITETFDDRSRQIIVENPQYIAALNQDIENGIYDKIMEAVQYQRDRQLLPPNVSDIEAYIKTVNDLAMIEQQSAGAQMEESRMSHDDQQQGVPSGETRTPPAAERRRKVSMSTSRKATKKAPAQEYDPLAMSDEEFEKMAKNMGIPIQ